MKKYRNEGLGERNESWVDGGGVNFLILTVLRNPSMAAKSNIEWGGSRSRGSVGRKK